MKTDTQHQVKTIDFLGLIADDRQIVVYRPRWNTFTGSVTRTIFLQQVVFWWVRAGRRPFYKFARPCRHRLYRPGDSWEEELAMLRREFENARNGISCRTHGDLDPDHIVSYWVDAQRVTWYALNEDLLFQHLAILYPTSPAATQPPLDRNLMDETRISSNVQNVHKPPSPLMDDPSISCNAQNDHVPMDVSSLSSDAQIIHPLYSENQITLQRSANKTTAIDPGASLVVVDTDSAQVTDPIPSILGWIGFSDLLSEKERAYLDAPSLLAWAWWIHLEEAKPTRPKNAVALARSQWRKGVNPREDLLNLARAWVEMSNEKRLRLLEALDFSARYGVDDPSLEEEYPNLPLTTAIALYRITGGKLVPPTLAPPHEQTLKAINEVRTKVDSNLPTKDRPIRIQSPIWKDALVELEMQMSRSTFAQWLQGTTAIETDTDLTVHVRNAYALDWLQNRLHPLIQRTVNSVAGRTVPINYSITNQEAQK